MTLPAHTLLSAEAAEAAYAISRYIDYPFAQFAGEQEQRLYQGGLTVAGNLESAEGVDWNPYNLIVDGDLVVDGDIDWAEYGGGCYVLVTGSVRCRNLLLQGCPSFVVLGDVTVANCIQGHHGDDGGVFTVRGATEAKLVLNTLYFTMDLGSPPSGLVCSDPSSINWPVDFSDDEEAAEIFLPDLLDGELVDEHAVRKALLAGREVLRPGIRPSHMVALEQIEALIDSGEPVTELDLSERKLRGFPMRILELSSLRRLFLADNPDIGAIPDEIATLAQLEELVVSKCGLTALPDGLAELDHLARIDVSSNPFDALPAVLGRLPSLRVLDASFLRCSIPDEIGAATGLEAVCLSFLRGAGDELVEFPRPILRLGRLKRLDLSTSALADLPDEIAGLQALEELNLDGAVGRASRLPPLHRLPRLRSLSISGGAGNTGVYPPASVLDQVWQIATLEHLGIDRYGEETQDDKVVREGLTALPDDAFSHMPNLKTIDLSFNKITHLPESFYALEHLREVDLQYTALDRATLDRLRTTFARVKLDLRHVVTRFDVDDPSWKKVHALVSEAAKSRDRAARVAGFEAALALCVPGACFSEYDELYALYGAIDGLGHLRLEAQGKERAAMSDKIVRYASLALERVPAPGTIWHYTDEGAFQEEVTRRCGNALAWILMERGDLEQGLLVIERALSVGGETSDALDTKVRLLLAAGREHDAFLIVDQLLTEDPSFEGFEDLKDTSAFQAWRQANR